MNTFVCYRTWISLAWSKLFKGRATVFSPVLEIACSADSRFETHASTRSSKFPIKPFTDEELKSTIATLYHRPAIPFARLRNDRLSGRRREQQLALVIDHIGQWTLRFVHDGCISAINFQLVNNSVDDETETDKWTKLSDQLSSGGNYQLFRFCQKSVLTDMCRELKKHHWIINGSNCD